MAAAIEPIDPRETAARALCEYEGVPEDTLFEDKPMWMSYLEQVDVVLNAIGWRPDTVASVIEE